MNLKVLACHTRIHCQACRTDPDWRERVAGKREFDCPHGVTADAIPTKPPLPPDADIRRAIANAEVCRECEHGSNVRLTVNSKRGIEPIFKVKCGLCSSCGGGLSLITGKCKLGLWGER